MGSTHEYVKILVEKVPTLNEMYKEHILDCGELLPHVFFGDLTRHVIDLFKDIKPEDLGNLKHSKYRELIEILGYLESGIRSNNDEVEELIVVSFLENISYCDKTLLPLVNLLSDEMKIWHKRIWRME